MSTPDLLIVDAITNRSVLAFTYDDQERFVEPHAFGKTSKGDLVMRGFQTGGASSSLNFGWKLFTVDKMINARIAPPRADFNPADKAMAAGVIIALTPEPVEA